jgi:hypothetical protein
MSQTHGAQWATPTARRGRCDLLASSLPQAHDYAKRSYPRSTGSQFFPLPSQTKGVILSTRCWTTEDSFVEAPHNLFKEEMHPCVVLSWSVFSRSLSFRSS